MFLKTNGGIDVFASVLNSVAYCALPFFIALANRSKPPIFQHHDENDSFEISTARSQQALKFEVTWNIKRT